MDNILEFFGWKTKASRRQEAQDAVTAKLKALCARAEESREEVDTWAEKTITRYADTHEDE